MLQLLLLLTASRERVAGSSLPCSHLSSIVWCLSVSSQPCGARRAGRSLHYLRWCPCIPQEAPVEEERVCVCGVRLATDWIMQRHPRYLGIPGLFRNTFGVWMFQPMLYAGVGECFEELLSNLAVPSLLVGCRDLQVSWLMFTASLLWDSSGRVGALESKEGFLSDIHLLQRQRNTNCKNELNQNRNKTECVSQL